MTFTARYGGVCGSTRCRYDGGRISEGDAVDYWDDELMHTACAAAAKRDDEIPYCTWCLTYHRGEC